MKRVKFVRSTAAVVRVFPEERDILRLNAGLHGMSMSEYIRQTCLGIRLRKTPKEERRLREQARIGVNLNQLAGWGNTASGRRKPWRHWRRITGLAPYALTEEVPEAEPC